MKTKAIGIFFLFLASAYITYQHFFATNLLVTSHTDIQILYRRLQENEKIIPLNEFFSRRYKKMGRTPLSKRLKNGTYLLQLKKSAHIPQLKKIKIRNNVINLNIILLAGYRFVNSGSYFYHGKRHKIKAFYLAEAELTNQQYLEFCNETGHEPPLYVNDSRFNEAMQPVIGINYTDAIEYTQWLSNVTGYYCRLPYEIEWQFAASQGDTSRIYPWGNIARPREKYSANYHPFNFLTSQLEAIDIDGFQYTAPVKSFRPTDKRFYDLGGNVFEWCLDSIRSKKKFPSYNLSKKIRPFARVVKGGSWNFNQLLMQIKNHIFVDGRIRRGNTGIRVLVEFQ